MIGWSVALVLYLLGVHITWWVYPRLKTDGEEADWVDRGLSLVWPAVEFYGLVMSIIYGEE